MKGRNTHVERQARDDNFAIRSYDWYVFQADATVETLLNDTFYDWYTVTELQNAFARIRYRPVRTPRLMMIDHNVSSVFAQSGVFEDVEHFTNAISVSSQSHEFLRNASKSYCYH